MLATRGENVSGLAKSGHASERAATFADDYSLTHRKVFLRDDAQKGIPRSQNMLPPAKHNLQNSDISDSSRRQSVPTCYYCKRKGHVMSECWALKKKEKSKSKADLVVQKSRTVQSKSTDGPSVESNDEYRPLISDGLVSLVGEESSVKPVRVLRDTGASQLPLLEGVLPLLGSIYTGSYVLLQGVGVEVISVPLHIVQLTTELVCGPVMVGVRPSLPVPGISLLLGNDLAGDKVMVNPCVSYNPQLSSVQEEIEHQVPSVFPSCAVTRAMTRKKTKQRLTVRADNNETSCGNVPIEVNTPNLNGQVSREGDILPQHLEGSPALTREQLIKDQQSDPELAALIQDALTEEEARDQPVCYFQKAGILMRKWRPPMVPSSEKWKVSYQIVVPPNCRADVLKLAHDTSMAGHLGINKTYQRILNHFYWPGIKKDVKQFCKSCHECQVVGKPNQSVQVAPLKPIPVVEEPFSRVNVDCVWPLPRTKAGNQYLLTIMCASTRFPEAIPLRNIKAKKLVSALIKFFTMVGLPRSIQSDQGSNFMSGLFQQVMHQLGIKQFKSSAYYPESQGALERVHQTLKNMMRTYCLKEEKEWDEGVNLLPFAVRESIQESLGFSPFKLVFGRVVRGPLKLLKETWLAEDIHSNILDHVSDLHDRLSTAA